jgi:hypothetical protein
MTMIPLLWTALGLTAAVAVAALVLALGLSARLREVSEQLSRVGTHAHDDGMMPLPGTPVPAFEATTSEGTSVSSEDLRVDDGLVLFLSTDCESCQEVMTEISRPGFTLPATSRRPLVVLIGPAGDRAAELPRIEPVAQVVEDDDHAGLAARFGVRVFPAVLLVRDGVVHQAANDLDEVMAGVPG